LFETGAPPPPPPLPVDVPLVVDHVDHVDHVDADRPVAVPLLTARVVGYEATSTVLPAGPPPGTVTYRLRATESSQGG
jgi:hypothetical protein